MAGRKVSMTSEKATLVFLMMWMIMVMHQKSGKNGGF